MKQVTRLGVYGIALEGNKILLVSKGPNGCYRNKLDLPGGGIEFGESSEETLRREFLEETGRAFQTMHLVNNVSHVLEVLDLPSPYHFHHLGQLYFISGLDAIPSTPYEQHDWYDFQQLKPEQLTPFAEIVIKDLQKQLQIKNVFRN
ncbi:RNA pyrophosphohydrolase [Candidatus Protochlamydia naegleriophila]|uniref:RNA pyrophosphohydrolase n=1 Tax=Candidatus Protochlamydia naegleriophila TaxID=389348 RepID=A0A0U5JG47_9BACT|nr:NUDIX domain-containing protein [Candidatus Protochlamydia naegleriophila]CUI16726.1 RNA pyrophosphohydrolase [Candidatus Protochlamydia naegleriophila]